MVKTFTKILSLTIGALIATGALAKEEIPKLKQEEKKELQSEEKTPYYQRPTKEGWWWYKDYTKEPQEAPSKTEKKQAEEEAKPFKPLKEYTFEELLFMHPDEFSKLYDYYLKRAVQRPTEENVYEFYNLQDVARKKALLFTHYSGYIWQKYPELSTERDIPIVGPGLTAKRNLVKEEIQKYVAKNATEYGYVVFVHPQCSYCKIQLDILKYAQQRGIPVKVIDISKNPSAQAQFNITVTPTIIVVDKKTGQYMPISAGVVSLDEIYTRTERAIRIITGEGPEHYGIYEFQKGTSLDPLEPPPLWKKEKK